MKETSKTLVVSYKEDPCFLNSRLYSIIEIKCANNWHGVSKIGYRGIKSESKKKRLFNEGNIAYTCA